MDTLTLTRPDDWHLRLRDGDALRAVAGAEPRRNCARAIVMPNLKPPVTTTAQRRSRTDGASWRHCRRVRRSSPSMTLYLTDTTSPDEIRAAKASGFVHGVKLYPAGATTHSEAGVSADAAGARHALEAMQAVDLPLLVHGRSPTRRSTCSTARPCSSTRS
jgi:dihydroorotase